MNCFVCAASRKKGEMKIFIHSLSTAEQRRPWSFHWAEAVIPVVMVRVSSSTS